MLMLDSDWCFWVWPSWATAFSFRWGDLPRLLSDPVAAGCLDENGLRALQQGFLVNEPGELEFFDGAFGNGVLAFRKPTRHTWIGGKVFNKEANITKALGMTTGNVAFLELRGDAGLRFALQGLKKPREYPCSISIEHVEAAGDDIYWLLDREPGSRPLKGLEQIFEAAQGFGLELEPLSGVCESALSEVKPWFTDDTRMAWFRVCGGRSKAGWQLAMMYYCAMHLKMLAGKRMRCMHLVAQVEGQPRSRYQWGRR
jgi:hypothetical protein